MSVGGLIAIVVFLIALFSFLVPMPGWIVMVLIGALAVAMLLGGYPISWRARTP